VEGEGEKGRREVLELKAVAELVAQVHEMPGFPRCRVAE
jgi:hypothetical protein